MSIDQSDKEAAAVAVAPRVSLADIEAAIKEKYEFTAAHAVTSLPYTAPEDLRAKLLEQTVPVELNSLSICIIILHNGFTVIGKSAPASPENFNADLGRKFAYEDAIRQLWPLMGFELRQRLHQQSSGAVP